MKRKGPAIEYTPVQEAAALELRRVLDQALELARLAGAKKFKFTFVSGKGGMFEEEYRREWDTFATPYAEAQPKPEVQPLARATV